MILDNLRYRANNYMLTHDLWSKASPLEMTDGDRAIRNLVETLFRLEIL